MANISKLNFEYVGGVNLFWKDESEAMLLGYNNGDQIFYWCFIAKCMDSDNTESFFFQN